LKRASGFLFIVVLLICEYATLIQIPSVNGTGSNWLTGWGVRKSHVINPATGAGANYQVRIIVMNGSSYCTSVGDTVYFDNLTQNDFDDVRFTDDDGNTTLDYWTQTVTVGVSATFWVEIADSLESDAQTIYVYVSNSTVSSASNGANTFIFFYDFDNESLPATLVGVAGTQAPVFTHRCIQGTHGYGANYTGATTATTDVTGWGFTVTLPALYAGVSIRTYQFGGDYQDYWHQHTFYNATLVTDFYSNYASSYYLVAGWAFYNYTIIHAGIYTVKLEFHKDHSVYARYNPTLVIDTLSVSKVVSVEPTHGAWATNWNHQYFTSQLATKGFKRQYLSMDLYNTYTGALWLQGWGYRKSHVIRNVTGADVNYQVQITVKNASGLDSAGTVYINNLTQNDFDDVRFTDDNGVTLLDYWRVAVNVNTNATFWVEIADNLTSTNVQIYIYYGNSTAATLSNFDTTFIFGDPWDNVTLNTSRWTSVTGTPTYSIDAATHILDISQMSTNTWFTDVGFNSKSVVFPSQWIIENAYSSAGVTSYMVMTSKLDMMGQCFDLRNASALTQIYTYETDAWSSEIKLQKGCSVGATSWAGAIVYSGFSMICTISKLGGYTSIVVDGTLRVNATDASVLTSVLLEGARYTTYTFGNAGFSSFKIRKYASSEPQHYVWGWQETYATYARIVHTLAWTFNLLTNQWHRLAWLFDLQTNVSILWNHLFWTFDLVTMQWNQLAWTFDLLTRQWNNLGWTFDLNTMMWNPQTWTFDLLTRQWNNLGWTFDLNTMMWNPQTWTFDLLARYMLNSHEIWTFDLGARQWNSLSWVFDAATMQWNRLSWVFDQLTMGWNRQDWTFDLDVMGWNGQMWTFALNTMQWNSQFWTVIFGEVGTFPFILIVMAFLVFGMGFTVVEIHERRERSEE